MFKRNFDSPPIPNGGARKIYTLMEELKYPIGKFVEPESYTGEQRAAWIRELEEFPSRLRAAVERLPDDVLDTPYRPGGWTVRQVVHHVADSHMNCYVRFKLALTEDAPVIKPYKEALWANLPEASHAPVSMSLDLLESIHIRLVAMLKNMQASEWDRTYFNPESKRDWKLGSVLALYAWHGKHHLAHVGLVTGRLRHGAKEGKASFPGALS